MPGCLIVGRGAESISERGRTCESGPCSVATANGMSQRSCAERWGTGYHEIALPGRDVHRP